MSAEAPLAPSAILPGIITQARAAAEQGATFDQLDVGLKQDLALFGEFSTHPDNLGDPGKRGRYRGQQSLKRTLGRLAANGYEAMTEAPNFQEDIEAGTLGLAMTLTYTGIRAVVRQGVHIARPERRHGRVVNGVVSAYDSAYATRDRRTADLLIEIFTGLHVKTPVQHFANLSEATENWQPEGPWDSAWVPPKQRYLADGQLATGDQAADTEPKADEMVAPHPNIVRVTNLNEYQRVITALIGDAMVPQELEEHLSVVLPDNKVELTQWLERHTIHPEILRWLKLKNLVYQEAHNRGFVGATYVSDPQGTKLKPRRRFEGIFATDPAPASKLERDALNGQDAELPDRVTGHDSGRDHREQDKRVRFRYWVEKGVHLYRKPLKPGEVRAGVITAQPVTIFRRTLLEFSEILLDVRENPRQKILGFIGKVGAEGLAKIIGGVQDVVVSSGILLARGAVVAAKGVNNYRKDMQGWKNQRREARTRLHTIADKLQIILEAIQSGDRPDEFPVFELPAGRARDLIRQASAIMMEDLGIEDSSAALNI